MQQYVLSRPIPVTHRFQLHRSQFPRPESKEHVRQHERSAHRHQPAPGDQQMRRRPDEFQKQRRTSAPGNGPLTRRAGPGMPAVHERRIHHNSPRYGAGECQRHITHRTAKSMNATVFSGPSAGTFQHGDQCRQTDVQSYPGATGIFHGSSLHDRTDPASQFHDQCSPRNPERRCQEQGVGGYGCPWVGMLRQIFPT